MNRLHWLLINFRNLPTYLAFRILKRSILKDPAYAEGWQANIAMAIYHESLKEIHRLPDIEGEIVKIERGEVDAALDPYLKRLRLTNLRREWERCAGLSPKFCDQAANRFMKSCFGVETQWTAADSFATQP